MVSAVASGRHHVWRWAALAALPLLVPQGASAAVVPGQIVAQEGSVPVGSPAAVGSIGAPFAEGSGAVAFRGELIGGDGFVFRDDQVVWLDSDEPIYVLEGGESSLGTNPAGMFIYSPTADANDSVYTHLGLLALEGDPAPDQPGGTNATFYSRPTMTLTGETYWVAGLNASGGAVTENRALMHSPDGTFATATAVLQSGAMVNGATYSLGGFDIAGPDGIDFDYQTSRLGTHLITVLRMDTGDTGNDHFVYVDGALQIREGDPIVVGENWDNFDLVTINDAGSFAFTGDTDGSLMSDEFVAFGAEPVVREGDVVDGIALTTPASVRLVSLNDQGVLVHAWGYGGGGESVFFSCNPSNALATSRALLTTGDTIDTNGDGIGEATVTDLLASTIDPGRALANDGSVYLAVELDEGGLLSEAIIQIDAQCCGNGLVDPGEGCDDGGAVGGDGCSALCAPEPATCGDGFVDPGETCDDMNVDDTDGCPTTCQTATCGDGYVQAGAEDCDDGNNDDTDGCRNNCSLPTCGDGVVWVGPEACDDNNNIDTDACTNVCQPAFCGDGITWNGMEGCDDGNDVDTDACLNNCEVAVCGDGIVHLGVEMCDDGNNVDSDRCPNNCAPATCGDGVVWAGEEECDDGNTDNTDGCLDTCVTAFCGDGQVWAGMEACDDGDNDDNDLCLTNCEFAECGDGVVFTGMEECDDGNSSNTDICTSNCLFNECGDGFVREGVEECDDGNLLNGDGCSNQCAIEPPDETGTGTDTGEVDSSGGPMNPPFPGSTSDDSGGTDPGSTSGALTGVALDDDGGCNCSASGRSPLRDTVGGLLALGLLGLGRRRRRHG